jgi:hypothetical protein
MTEWLSKGLQHLLQWFESTSDLQIKNQKSNGNNSN